MCLFVLGVPFFFNTDSSYTDDSLFFWFSFYFFHGAVGQLSASYHSLWGVQCFVAESHDSYFMEFFSCSASFSFSTSTSIAPLFRLLTLFDNTLKDNTFCIKNKKSFMNGVSSSESKIMNLRNDTLCAVVWEFFSNWPYKYYLKFIDLAPTHHGAPHRDRRREKSIPLDLSGLPNKYIHTEKGNSFKNPRGLVPKITINPGILGYHSFFNMIDPTATTFSFWRKQIRTWHNQPNDRIKPLQMLI